jgi:diacylglycerol kinase (ATP)
MRCRIQIIVTPGSGEGRALATARHLNDLLEQRGHATAIRTYKSLSALLHWARTCERDFTHLVCVGGDATQSAAAAAAVRLDVPFVPVPNGFGNMFARAFGHPRDAEDVAKLLEEGELQRVDVGKVDGGDLFLSHHSYGMLQQIQETVEKGREQPRSRAARYLAYWAMARRFVAAPPPPSLRVEIDGTLVADGAGIVTVANVETYRGFLSLTPLAVPLDGLLDVFVAPRASNVHLMARLLPLMFRVPGRWNGVLLRQGRHVVVTVDERRREGLRTLPRALPLLVPPGSIERLVRRARARTAPMERVAA